MVAGISPARTPASCNAPHRPGWHGDRVGLSCVIVDDNGPFRQAARMLIERAGVSVAATAATTAEALDRVRALEPDVVLVDVALGTENGGRPASMASEHRET